jgi:hypothetical protein
MGGSGGGFASSSSSGSGGSAGAAVGGSAGSGGVGGVDPLDDDALVVRYFLDEAASGQVPGSVQDSAPNPMDMPLSYSAAMSWVESQGHRGLSWASAGQDGHAAIATNGSKIRSMLDGSTQATIEVVVALQSVDALGSRLVHLGTGMDPGRFTLASGLPNSFDFRLSNVTVGNWTAVWPSYPTRAVLHMVLDTTQANAADRALLFVDGAVKGNNVVPPLIDATIAVPNSEFFVLGNRQVGGRSIAGVLHYVAVYAKPLTTATIEQHVSRLTVSDDTTP